MDMPRKSGRSADTDRKRELEHGERQRMVREAAYYRFIRRGQVHGHDLEDWLAAEAELFSPSPEPRPVEIPETPDFGMQQHSVYGTRTDKALKRIIKKHPQRGIPQIEGIDPQEAPLRE